MSLTDADRDHVGYRFQQWTLSWTEGYWPLRELSSKQKANGYEQFAVEFESMPIAMEPYVRWGAIMAYLCRRCAKQHRGEPLPEWDPPKMFG
jgi:hypothetical protein